MVAGDLSNVSNDVFIIIIVNLKSKNCFFLERWELFYGIFHNKDIYDDKKAVQCVCVCVGVCVCLPFFPHPALQC